MMAKATFWKRLTFSSSKDTFQGRLSSHAETWGGGSSPGTGQPQGACLRGGCDGNDLAHSLSLGGDFLCELG